MENWLQRVKASIFPRSREKSDIRAALSEWFYTGDTYDLEYPSADCELCGHKDIRFQFTIENSFTQKDLLIGSECITRFDIRAVDEEGHQLDSETTKKTVQRDRRKLITNAKEKRMFTSLVRLGSLDQDFEIDSFISYYGERKAFTPKQLAVLLWRLEKFGVEHKPTDFKLTIRRNREKNQLLTLKDFQVRAIWKCLSASQKRFYENNT
ncbi:hypothetical protein [Cerasicoccus fimbriatus]|uniref:hypothetical protein n=1 Tax=Cerasicoccus fimbriatus TaxID=3014554 RepID=UPI0022B3AA45|nr:hypothetical protein [Cerasicoccus sp. TK19100]